VNSGSGNKNLKRRIRELCGIAYEREMRRHLDALLNQFIEYGKGKITPWEMVDVIHKFHNEDARKLYIFYQKPNEYVIAYAVSEKLIDLSDVPAQLQDEISKFQDLFLIRADGSPIHERPQL